MPFSLVGPIVFGIALYAAGFPPVEAASIAVVICGVAVALASLPGFMVTIQHLPTPPRPGQRFFITLFVGTTILTGSALWYRMNTGQNVAIALSVGAGVMLFSYAMDRSGRSEFTYPRAVMLGTIGTVLIVTPLMAAYETTHEQQGRTNTPAVQTPG